MAKHIPYADVGEYRLLYKYLRDRFADRVVLTFGQIEDLLGFSLPSVAGLQCEWWSAAPKAARDAEPSASWTLADRTATVNLAARTVAFERN